MQVAVTDSAGADSQQHLRALRRRRRLDDFAQRRPELSELVTPHSACARHDPASSAARRLVPGVQRLDRIARSFPFRVAPAAQFIEIASGRPGPRAIHPDRLAAQPFAAIRHQERREILQFLHPADATHRIARGGRAGLGAGHKALLMPSVGISPGAMALRRMPWRPHSCASDMVIAWIAALLIAEGTTNGPPLRTQVTAIETTLPFCLAEIQRLPTACVT